MSDSNSNRRDPFSEEFKKFITSGWAPYSSELPARRRSAAFAAARRARISEQFPGATLVFPAGALKVRANDTDYRFRPDSIFAYFTGLGTDREPDAVAVVTPEGEGIVFFRPRAPRTDREFYADARYGEMWVGKRDSLEEMESATGMECRDIRTLKEYLAGADKIAVVRTVDPAITALVDEVRGGESEDDAALLERQSAMRFVKDEYEIDEIGRALAATKVAYDAVLRELPNAVAAGRGERWIEGIFALHARHLGNGVGYETIAAAGDNANTLHWVRNDSELRDGELLLIDAGIEVDSLYTADITRTFPINGKFTPQQRRVYDAVNRAQDAAMSVIRDGAPFKEVHNAAIRVVAEFCEELGILPVSAEESLKEEGGYHRRWMVHGTSHHLGLDVHDCSHAPREEYREGNLKAGMVLTIEPGIYFKADDLLVPEEYRGIGIRVEENVLVTEDGCVVLSDAFPRTADEVEAWIADVQS